ncbi:MAG: hypothetical protein ACI9SP_001265 [Arenicella sp.]|jgi:hypothetical protein
MDTGVSGEKHTRESFDKFYFVRSWTSDLVYKVKYRNTGDSLVFSEI